MLYISTTHIPHTTRLTERCSDSALDSMDFLIVFLIWTYAQSGYPPYNIRKLNDLQYVVELALAGFSKSDIEVEVTDGTLTIRSATAKDDGADNDET